MKGMSSFGRWLLLGWVAAGVASLPRAAYADDSEPYRRAACDAPDHATRLQASAAAAGRSTAL